MATGILLAVGPGFGGDGGFWYIGADGKLHRVPPWSPDVMRDLNAAATLVSVAQNLKEGEVSRQLTAVAEKLISAHTHEIQQHTEKLGAH